MPKSVIAFLILATSVAFSQQTLQRHGPKQRYLISADNEVYSLPPGQSATDQMSKILQSRQTGASADCENPFTFGYQPEIYSPGSAVVIRHKEVEACWFVAPATGTIDSIYWFAYDFSPEQNAPLVSITVRRSNVGPGLGGPGFDLPAVCYSWGYFRGTTDADQGIEPFRESATDTAWVSTIRPPYTTRPLMGEELWGLGGFPAANVPGQVNAIALADFGYSPHVSKDEIFFITMGTRYLDHPLTPETDKLLYYPLFDQHQGAPVPCRRWKFHEHGYFLYTGFGIPWGCNSIHVDTIGSGSYMFLVGPLGWYARGSIIGDTLSSLHDNWWYTMTVEGDLPPTFVSVEKLTHTLSTSPLPISIDVEDCNPGAPGDAGVSEVKILFRVSGSDWDSASLGNTGGGMYTGSIPAQQPGSTLDYKLIAIDNHGNSTSFGPFSFRVVRTFTDFYSCDTVKEFDWTEIHSTGTKIGNWFTRLEVLPIDSTDNTTAGPFDLGGEFSFFGHAVRYCWIGVDGGFHVTASPTDTMDLGFSVWNSNVPSAGLGNNLISPFSHDFYAEPRVFNGKGYGNVYYKIDGTRFIVEWDHIGYTSNPDDTTITFEAILERSDNSITFLYKDIGTGGVETGCLVGLQADTSVGHYFFVLDKGYPLEWRPQNSRGLRFTTNFQIAATEGWNLVSAPGTLPDPRKSVVFPAASSPAFSYEGTYMAKDLIEKGKGYWVKYPAGTTSAPINGTELLVDTIPLQPGWNMIGSVSHPVAVTSITSDPPGMTTSSFFGYNGSYFPADTIDPGKGYWVRSSTSGTIILSARSLTSSARIHIVTINELPPPPPNDMEHPASTIPKEFSLSQNYPNPFNPSTTIIYELPKASIVTLKVYNMLGQLVATLLAKEQQEPGLHRVAFNPKALPSGVYFYTITAGSFIETKKMVLIQ